VPAAGPGRSRSDRGERRGGAAKLRFVRRRRRHRPIAASSTTAHPGAVQPLRRLRRCGPDSRALPSSRPTCGPVIRPRASWWAPAQVGAPRRPRPAADARPSRDVPITSPARARSPGQAPSSASARDGRRAPAAWGQGRRRMDRARARARPMVGGNRLPRGSAATSTVSSATCRLIKLCTACSAAGRGRGHARLLEPYGEWAGLASVYLLARAVTGLKEPARRHPAVGNAPTMTLPGPARRAARQASSRGDAGAHTSCELGRAGTAGGGDIARRGQHHGSSGPSLPPFPADGIHVAPYYPFWVLNEGTTQDDAQPQDDPSRSAWWPTCDDRQNYRIKHVEQRAGSNVPLSHSTRSASESGRGGPVLAGDAGLHAMPLAMAVVCR
jgi:hypothetical protein